MTRRILGRALLFATLLLACTPAAPAGEPGATPPRAAPPKAIARGVAPSAVLARADERLGSQGVNFPEQPQRVGEDRTLAPYFAVQGDGATEMLPLEDTSAQVDVAGVIARVRVTQVFRNSGSKPIEAVYVFPASTRAAVHGMRMKIGERTIEARIERRAEARVQYEQARRDGKRAALLEQERPNVFTMNVANIMPRDRIVAELEYSELIVPEAGVYEIVYPTVVGPRYGGGADPAKDRWVANPYLRQGEKEPYRFDIRAHLETGIGLHELVSPSHAIDVAYRSRSSADVTLKEKGGGNKDFILRWRLAGANIETGVLAWQGEGEGYFLATVEPPATVESARIPPREYVFVIDVSGSMHGFPLDTSKELMRNVLGRLRPEDSFNVVFFSGGSWALSRDRSLPATPRNVQRALEAIGREQGGGGTELMQGLRTAYALPRADERVSRSVVVVTDGYVAVESQAFKFVRERLNEANVFAFGIGSSVNRGLIEALARAGQGEPYVVLSPEKARAEAERLRAVMERPVLSRLEYRFDGFDAREVAPMRLPDVMAERPVVLFGKFSGELRGKIILSGRTASGRMERVIEVTPAAARAENAALRVLWARKWVELLEDEQHLGPAQEIVDAITDLGLSHRILTPYTSFVAVDSHVVNAGGSSARVSQPLPLPEGVSDLAVGGLGIRGSQRSAPKGAGLLPHGPSAPFAAYAPAEASASLGDVGKGFAAPEPKPVAADRAAKRKAEAADPIVSEQVTGLADATALRGAVRAALLRAAAQGKVQGRIEVRLTLDASGKVTKVEVLSAPSPRVKGELERLLTGLRSASRPASGTSATYRLTAVLGG